MALLLASVIGKLVLSGANNANAGLRVVKAVAALGHPR